MTIKENKAMVWKYNQMEINIGVSGLAIIKKEEAIICLPIWIIMWESGVRIIGRVEEFRCFMIRGLFMRECSKMEKRWEVEFGKLWMEMYM